MSLIPRDPSWDKVPNTVQDLLKNVTNYTKPLRDGVIDVKRTTRFVSKNIQENINLTNELLQGADAATRQANAAKAGNTLRALAVIGGAAFLYTLQVKVSEFTQFMADRRTDSIDAELTTVNGRAVQALAQIKVLVQRIEANRLDNQRTRDRVYGVENQLPKIRENSNNALYETRQGRKIAEGKIALQFNLINSIGQQFRNLSENTKDELDKVLASVRQAQQQSAKANEKVNVQERILNDVQKLIAKLIPTAKDDNKDTFITRNEATNLVTRSQDVLKNLIGQTNKKLDVIDAEVDILRERTTTNDKRLDDEVERLKKAPTILNPEQIKADLTQQKQEIEKLSTRLREQEKVNQEGNRKLDQMLPFITQIPLIPGRAAETIKPNIPTPNDITNATGKAICNSTNGGCLGNALGNTANTVNANMNSRFDALGAANGAANAAQLAQLGEILKRIGAAIPGGLSGWRQRFSKWSMFNQAVNLLTMAATFHNALMLSNDIGQTLLGALSNVLQLFGFKDSEGNAYNIGEIIRVNMENLIISIVGKANYESAAGIWSKANRIYQATANAVMSFQNIGHTILNGLEIIGGQNGKIGNALKAFNVVGERAYEWMNPQPNYHSRILRFFENAQEGANTIQQVTQAPLDVANAVTEFNNSTTELIKAVKEEPGTAPGVKAEEAQATKKKEDELKAQVSGLVVGLEDIFRGDG